MFIPRIAVSLSFSAYLFTTGYAQLPDARFIGYVGDTRSPNTYNELICDNPFGGDKFWRCSDEFCDCLFESSDLDDIQTTCGGGSIVGPSSTETCLSTKTACLTNIIYESMGAPSPKTDYACHETASVATLYRTLPEGAAYVPVGGARTFTVPITSTDGSPTSAATMTASAPESLATALESLATESAPDPSAIAPPPQAQEQRGGESKAWIAGAVIGALAGLAVLVLGTWFLLRRRRRARARDAAALSELPDSDAKWEMEAKRPPLELTGRQDPQELES